jgi:hypothetical protein
MGVYSTREKAEARCKRIVIEANKEGRWMPDGLEPGYYWGFLEIQEFILDVDQDNI